MNLVGGQASGGADRIVVGELHVRQLRIPIVLLFVDDNSQHLGHCVVNTLHTTVTAWMVGAGGDFSNTQKLIHDVRKFGAELLVSEGRGEPVPGGREKKTTANCVLFIRKSEE